MEEGRKRIDRFTPAYCAFSQSSILTFRGCSLVYEIDLHCSSAQPLIVVSLGSGITSTALKNCEKSLITTRRSKLIVSTRKRIRKILRVISGTPTVPYDVRCRTPISVKCQLLLAS